jgi:hypothetical protein
MRPLSFMRGDVPANVEQARTGSGSPTDNVNSLGVKSLDTSSTHRQT